MSTAAAEHKSSLADVDDKGGFKRKPSQFRNFISSNEDSPFKPQSGRYHLYVSLACPWAHRTLIVRSLKGLESAIGVSVVNSLMGDKGWNFEPSPDNLVSDDVNHAHFLREVYIKADPSYTGRITVPILWDKQQETIVCNESSEIIRMLNSEFNEFSKYADLDLYPQNLREKIDAINALVYSNVNDGVYKCGFAKTQEAYPYDVFYVDLFSRGNLPVFAGFARTTTEMDEEAYDNLFNALDELEAILSKSRYLAGDRLTEADVRLFTTLIRFDAVYAGHFKCNKKQLREYPSLLGFLRELYQNHHINSTVNFKHIKDHYYQSHRTINPTGVVPKGPGIIVTNTHGHVLSLFYHV